MKRALTNIIIITAAVMLCCCDSDNGTIYTPSEKTARAMRFDVCAKGVEGATRGLINSGTDLIHACTPVADGGEGNAIGFWIDYVDDDAKTVFPINGIAHLIYKEKAGSSHMWNYEGADLLWADKGNYVIRAYYPQSMASSVIEGSTDAQLFCMEYNTHYNQDDLMLAANEVIVNDTVCQGGAPSIGMAFNAMHDDVVMSDVYLKESDHSIYGFSQSFNLGNPIPLRFDHTLAAVRVRFAFAFDYEDELLAVSFHNNNNNNNAEEHGLKTVGVLVYGDEDDTYFTPYETDFLAKRYENEWFSYQTSWVGSDFYEWEINPDRCDDNKGITVRSQTTESGGVTTVTEQMAVAYSKTNRHVTRTIIDGVVQPSMPETADNIVKHVKAEENPYMSALPRYNENDGYLLVIPQEAPNATTINVKFRKQGEYSVTVPPFTGTDKDGNEISDPSATHYFVAGHRYTYTVVIDKMDCDITVDVMPWDDYKFEHTIRF